MRWFHATHASLSASSRASFAFSAEYRIECPKMCSRDLVLISLQDAPGRAASASRYRLRLIARRAQVTTQREGKGYRLWAVKQGK